MKAVFPAVACLVSFLLPQASLCAPDRITSDGKTSGSQGRVSHQMNQPPPEPPDRYKLSQERIDEITNLFKDAQQELVHRNGQSSGPAPHPGDK
ncbi:MAG: hypothetical protein V2B18_19940 [Pseudomonadota bacterium]